MSKQSLSNTDLFLRLLREFLLSVHSWILGISLLLLWLDSHARTLFGMSPQESLAATLAYSPAQPWRFGGGSAFTFSLVHVGYAHWLVSALFWALFAYYLNDRIPGQGVKKQLSFVFLYPLASFGIALSYLLPWAPAAAPADRVLGLSALVLFQLGLLLPLRAPIFLWLLVPLLGWFTLTGSALTNWGHVAGFALGLLSGLLLRRRRPSGASASRPSYPR